MKGGGEVSLRLLVLLWVGLLGGSLFAQSAPQGQTVELTPPPPRPILWAPLDDRGRGDILLNRVTIAESGRLVVVGGGADVQAFARELPFAPEPETGAPRVLRCLLLPDSRTHAIFPIPAGFSLEEGTLELTWQPVPGGEEFGALFVSDTDTAFQAFLAAGRLHFRVAGGQVSVAHRPRRGQWHRYRFLWQRSAGRRAVFIDGELAAQETGEAWQQVEVGRELFFNGRANQAFPGRGGAPGYYARVLIHAQALEPELDKGLKPLDLKPVEEE